MKFSRRSKRFVIVRRSAAVVFALISMTLFFQFSSGVEVHATTKTEFNDTENPSLQFKCNTLTTRP
ncbi:hypothetical protein FAM22278_02706 [Lacticaseibacillus paracasei]|nr:hypothetical protein FAM22278_02706 [Lacticaseibacillus paracasei]